MYNGEQIYASAANSDDLQLIVANAGPFEVTSQNTGGIIYQGGSSQTVSWNVNGTDQAPINTQTLSISMSVDGGYTYPYTVLQNTANNGSAQIIVPNVSATNCRFKVEADGNIYFDLNTADFEVQQTTDLRAELDAASFSIDPNPANTFFRLQTSSKKEYQLELRDLNGRQFDLPQMADKYDISHLPAGTYFVTIIEKESQQRLTKKLIIQR